jgi:plasmid stabilization system protein ParE
MTPVHLEPEAVDDLEKAYAWYEDIDAGLGERLKAEVRACLATIAEYPQSQAEWRPGVRRAVLSVFPYLVYYLIGTDEVRVIAILHGAMTPGAAEGRIADRDSG